MNEVMVLEPKDLEGKFLTFNLIDELYGINVDWFLQIIVIPFWYLHLCIQSVGSYFHPFPQGRADIGSMTG